MTEIPTGLIGISFKDTSRTKTAIQPLASRFWFVSETELRIINSASIDVVLDVVTLQIKSFVGLENQSSKSFSDSHAYLDKVPLAQDKVLERLVRKATETKQVVGHLR